MTKEKKQLFSDKNCERVQMWKTLFYAYKLTTMKKTDVMWFDGLHNGSLRYIFVMKNDCSFFHDLFTRRSREAVNFRYLFVYKNSFDPIMMTKMKMVMMILCL